MEVWRLQILVTFLLYINNFTEPVTKLVHFTEQFQNGYSGYDRFLEMMAIAPDIEDAPDAVSIEKAKGEIEFKEVSFRYEDNNEEVLSHVNLEVKPETMWLLWELQVREKRLFAV